MTKTLREIDKDIWVIEQPLRYFGLSVGTRMTVVRLTNCKLAIISPIIQTQRFGLRPV
ncbi:MAG: hypothetical protein WBA76_15970 [Phormidesmis sp.]